MATKKAAAKKSPAKKAPAKKSAAKKRGTTPLPDGVGKYTINLPIKLVKKLVKESDRRRANDSKITDGRWGYQSLIREILEKATEKFK